MPDIIGFHRLSQLVIRGTFVRSTQNYNFWLVEGFDGYYGSFWCGPERIIIILNSINLTCELQAMLQPGEGSQYRANCIDVLRYLPNGRQGSTDILPIVLAQ